MKMYEVTMAITGEVSVLVWAENEDNARVKACKKASIDHITGWDANSADAEFKVLEEE